MGAMCRGDVSVITHRWKEGSVKPNVEQRAPHQCVDWDAVTGFAAERTVDIWQEGYIRNPKTGQFLFDFLAFLFFSFPIHFLHILQPPTSRSSSLRNSWLRKLVMALKFIASCCCRPVRGRSRGQRGARKLATKENSALTIHTFTPSRCLPLCPARRQQQFIASGPRAHARRRDHVIVLWGATAKSAFLLIN